MQGIIIIVKKIIEEVMIMKLVIVCMLLIVGATLAACFYCDSVEKGRNGSEDEKGTKKPPRAKSDLLRRVI
jgi:hypothetical protein